jgi:steroid delta-isomerase-like uncharacterized protein
MVTRRGWLKEDHMSEANKALIRRFYDHVWNKAEYWAADDLVAPDYLRHAPTPIRGRDGIRETVEQVRSAFPDLFITIEDLISEGDRLAVRWHAYGTHKGVPFRGIEPQGRPAQITGITVTHFHNGQIQEEWSQWDMLGLMKQLQAEGVTAAH